MTRSISKMAAFLLAMCTTACVVEDRRVDYQDEEAQDTILIGPPKVQLPRPEIADSVVDDGAMAPPPETTIGAQRHRFDDLGDVCIHADELSDAWWQETTTELAAGDVFVASVTFPSCLSQSCHIDRVASCAVERFGDQLVITSEFHYTALELADCTADCGALVAECESEPLDAGTYEVVFADRSVTLAVDGSIETCPEALAERGEIL